MKILLALDHSPESQTALREAAGRLWPAGSTFDVITVVEPAHLWALSESATDPRAAARELIERATETLRAASWPVESTVVSGDPKRAILDRVETAQPDLIVIGSHRSALTKFMLGGVSSAVLRYAHCSVHIARGAVAGHPSRILLATDGSPCSEAAARLIAERPWNAGSEVRILTGIELTLPGARAYFEAPFVDAQFLEDRRAEAMAHAQSAVASAQEILAPGRIPLSDSISVLLESPKKVILDEAANWGADVIFLGSHGHKGVERFLLGSVSEAVALHAPCSVEVVRAN